MSLTEKGKNALYKIKEYYLNSSFSAADLSTACGEKIYAATLNSLANEGYLIKLGGSPVQYQPVDVLEELINNIVEINNGCTNTNLRSAARVKNDEFYTRYEDIEAEVMKYRKCFKNKIVYLPCDDPAEKKSEFWSFFVNNFDVFGLKKVIATHYEPNGQAYKIWVDETTTTDGFITEEDALQEDLIGNGDFRSAECVEIMKECDIVCTNPPFSLFSELVLQILQYNKDFLLIGSDNKITDKTIFPLFKEEKIVCGYNSVKKFIQPDQSIKSFGNIHWFTTLKTIKADARLFLNKTYNPEEYPKYDNINAIEVGRVVNIPKDYEGLMGVPISILYNVNFSTNQFEIIGILHSPKVNEEEYNFGMPEINGKSKYARILIKNKEL